MIWLIFFILLIILVVIVAIAMRPSEAQKTQDFSELSESRVAAYAQYLRRTAAHADMARVSEAELLDFVRTNIREYNAELKTANASGCGYLGGFGFIGLLLGLIGGWVIPVFGFVLFFGFFLGIGAILSQMATARERRKIDEKFRRRGLDPERLKVIV